MIPTLEDIYILWDRYHLPQNKRIHVTLVAQVADFLARMCAAKIEHVSIDIDLLRAASLLHDIDKGAEKMPEEIHPDAAVRILRCEGYDAVAQLVKTHSLYCVLDPLITPTTWEEKVLYLADKMVKYTIITVDERFALWRAEQLPQEAIVQLDRCYPLVKKIEKEIFTHIGIQPEGVSAIIGYNVEQE